MSDTKGCVTEDTIAGIREMYQARALRNHQEDRTMIEREGPYRGRPSSFTQEVADEICDRLAKGESLRAITADTKAGWLPSETTVRRWLAGEDEWSEGFRRQYAYAREAQAERYAEEIVAISDGKDVDESASPEERAAAMIRDPNRDRLRIDARKWVASKLLPKKYGDKVDVALSGNLGIREWLNDAE